VAGLYFDAMTTLVGLFFSLISVLGFLMGQSKKFLRKIVLIAFSLGLILAQALFVYSKITMDGHDFVLISGFVGAIILILSFQRNEVW
jgi:hypothetical protein